MNILVVDDHTHVRMGTKLSLREIVPDGDIVEAESLSSARKKFLEGCDIDLVLLDLYLGDSAGIETLRALRGSCEAIGEKRPRIVIVSGNEDPDLIESVLNEHGTGFIPKGVGEAIFKQAVQLTLAGGVYIPEIYLRARQARLIPNAADSSSAEKSTRLTEMERVVVSYCVQGLTYKEIAKAISEQRDKKISDLTVKTHVKNIAIKLGIQGEGKAAVVAQISRLDLRFPSAGRA